MIKPILYHSFEEKAILERQLLADVPQEKRMADAKALMDIFYKAGEDSRKSHLKKKSKLKKSK